jgi:hypothetical protein
VDLKRSSVTWAKEVKRRLFEAPKMPFVLQGGSRMRSLRLSLLGAVVLLGSVTRASACQSDLLGDGPCPSHPLSLEAGTCRFD